MRFVIEQLRARQRTAEELKEQIANLLVEQRTLQVAGGAPVQMDPVEADILERVRRRAEKEFGMIEGDARMAMSRLDVIIRQLKSTIQTFESPVAFLLMQDDGGMSGYRTTEDVEGELQNRFHDRNGSQEVLDDLRNTSLFPVYGFELEMDLERTPDDLEAEVDSAEADNYVLFHKGQEQDTYDSVDSLEEAVMEMVRDLDADVGDFTFDKIETTTYSFRSRGGYELVVEFQD